MKAGDIVVLEDAQVIGHTEIDFSRVGEAVRLYKTLIEKDRESAKITQDLFELVNTMTDQERKDYYDKTR